MIVKWYHTFSAWSFIAAILYGFGINPINPYPLNIMSALGGIFHFLYGFVKESRWKLIFIVILFHSLPFLWLPPVLTISNMMNNLYLIIAYLLFMLISNKNIIQVYKVILNEPSISIQDFLNKRL